MMAKDSTVPYMYVASETAFKAFFYLPTLMHFPPNQMRCEFAVMWVIWFGTWSIYTLMRRLKSKEIWMVDIVFAHELVA